MADVEAPQVPKGFGNVAGGGKAGGGGRLNPFFFLKCLVYKSLFL